MSTGKVILAVVGGFFALVGLAVTVGGGALAWAYSTQRNADGFFTSAVAEMSAEGYAITSTELDLGSLPDLVFGSGWLATIQVSADSTGDAPLFVGIGRAGDVDAYLAGVAHAEVTDIDSRTDITSTNIEGGPPDGPPSEQGFWAESASGEGPQDFIWDLEQGDWTIVIMNADASAGVEVDVSAGARTNWVPVTIALLIVGGLFCLAVAAVMGFFALRRPAATAPAATPPPGQAPPGA